MYNDAWLSSRERSEIRLEFGLVWFDAKRPGKQFFSHVGTENRFLCITSIFYYIFFLKGGGGKYVLLKDTRTRVGLDPPPLFWIQRSSC